MRKWKRDCLLKKELNKTSSWKSDKGFTLVELLASIALLSVVILLAGSVHIFGQRQFISQTEAASQANDMSYALSVMSRDLRKEEGGNVTVENGNVIKINDNTAFNVDGSGTLYKNSSEVLATDVDSFSSEKIVDGEGSFEGLKITLTSSSEHSSPQKTYQTTIYFRR